MKLVTLEYQEINNQPNLVLFTREDRIRSTTIINNFRPYFYIPLNESDEYRDPQPGDIESETFKALDGETTIKYFTQTPGQVTEARKLFSKTYEADVRFTERFLIDKVPQIEKCELRVQYTDIETDIETGDLISIASFDSYLNKVVCFVWREDLTPTVEYTSYMFPSGYQFKATIHYYKSKLALLADYIKFIRDTDPDILTGWYFLGFDMLEIIRQINGTRNLTANSLSPMGNCYEIKEDRQTFEDKVFCKGRVLWDMLKAYAKLQPTGLPDASLEAIAQKELGEGKHPHQQSITWMWKNDLPSLVKYNAMDSVLVQRIDQKCQVLELYDSRRRWVGCGWSDLFKPTFMWDVKFLRSKTSVLPTKKRIEIGDIKGAEVFNPLVKGIHNWIILLDLKSLYPNIITTFNISPETFTKDKNNCYNLNNGISFKKDPIGLLPKVLSEMFLERQKYKDEMKKYPFGTEEYDVWDRLQTSVKVMMNSCFTPDTKILTPTGLKLVTDFKVGDLVYTMNSSMRLEIDEVVNTIERNFEGDLISLKTKNIDLKVTPDHIFTVFTKKRYRKRVRVKASRLGSRFIIPQVKGVDEKNRERLQNTFDITKYITIPIKRNKKRIKATGIHAHWIPRTYKPIDFLKFLAWYITEGSIIYYPKYNTKGISIAQTVYREELEELIKRMRLPYSSSKEAIRIHSLPLANLLETQCGRYSRNKHIPSWIFSLNYKYLDIFFKELLKGDGDVKRNRYTTISEKLADDFFHLTNLLGKCSHIKKDDQGFYRITWWSHSASGRHLQKGQISKEYYKGKVYCITAKKNHFILAGRNGFLTLTGQCYGAIISKGDEKTSYSNFRLASKEVGSSITFMGRETVKRVKIKLEQMGYKVLAGDTDSVFLFAHNSSLDDCITEANNLVEEINKDLKTFIAESGGDSEHSFITIEAKKIYNQFVMFQKKSGKKGEVAKKRYGGKVLWNEGKKVEDPENQLDFMGIEARRSNSSELSRELQKKVLRVLLGFQDKSFLKEYIKEARSSLTSEPLNYELIGIPQGIKELSTYKISSPWVKGAKWSNAWLNLKFTVGDKPKLLYVKSVPPEYPKTDVLCFRNDRDVPKGVVVDTEKMFEKNVVSKLESLFDAANINTEEIYHGQSSLTQYR